MSSHPVNHQERAELNSSVWRRKPLLRRIYHRFHDAISAELARLPGAPVVELGSGIGNIRETIPDCLRTDVFPGPGVDLAQTAYALALADESVSDLILFDVFHHLRYPGDALDEFYRVLIPGGRVILFEPCISALGWLVYGPLHEEDIGWKERIQWRKPEAAGDSGAETAAYAAQGNATRIFLTEYGARDLSHWTIRRIRRYSAISYVASGGFSGPQLYPAAALRLMLGLDRFFDLFPRLFATRLLVVLERPMEWSSGDR